MRRHACHGSHEAGAADPTTQVTKRLLRRRLVASVLAVVVVAGCSGGSVPAGSGGPDRSERVPVAEAGAALPQGQRAPLELGGGFGRWSEVFGGTFQYWTDDFSSAVSEPKLEVHLAPTGDTGHVSWDCGEPASSDRLEFLDGERVVYQVPVSGVETILLWGDRDWPDGPVYMMEYSWCAVVSQRPAYDSYRIVSHRTYRGGQPPADYVLMHKDASPNAPVVSIASPVRRQRFDAVEVTVEWSAWDADADELTSQVFYTADGGAIYRWVYAERHPPADAAARIHRAISGYRADFDSTEQARFLVVVSDGARWTAALSPAFTVD